MGDHRNQPDRYQLERELAQEEIHDADAPCVAHHGRTNFEKHQLNEMKDMVDLANPEHLEDAGKGLWDARDAILAAADELFAHINRIDWHGEAATAFHKWASGFITSVYTFADHVENVGAHITAASTGLASVRKSMPPRDTRFPPMSVHDFPLVAQVPGNKDYQAALTVEKHRQEAINQMNRLASYYTVTGEALRPEWVPTFGKMPDMGVPRARTEWRDGGSGEQTSSPGTPGAGGGEPVRPHSLAAPAGPDAGQTPEPVKKLHDVVTAPDRHVHTDSPQHVGTNIDSVKTLPPDTVKSTAPVTAPTAPAPGGGGGPVPPVPVGPVAQTVRLPVGPGGTSGPRGPIRTTSRLAPPAGGSSRVGGGTGRGPAGPVGRTAVPGEVEPRGPVSPAGRAPVGKAPVGRAPLGEAPVGRAPVGKAPVARNVIGGTSRPVGVPAEGIGGTGPTGAARTSGVVGGKQSTPPAQSVNGSTVPRGTVIGGEPASRTPRTGERPGQRGVIGAPRQTGGAGQTPRSPVTPTGRVVGTSIGKAPTASKDGRASGVRRGSARDDDRTKSRRQQSPETE